MTWLSPSLSNTLQSSLSNYHFLPLFWPLKLTTYSLLCQAYPGPALPSCLHPNRPRFSTDYTCSQASEHHLHPHSYGLAYSNLDLYPALSGCSSRAQSVSSIAMLEELRTCGIDSEGASESPSPTHCQLNSCTDNMAIDIAIASTANVTIPHGLDLITALCSVLQFCIFHSEPHCFYLLWLPISKASLSWP